MELPGAVVWAPWEETVDSNQPDVVVKLPETVEWKPSEEIVDVD